jgi:CDP-diacylglycerol--glycerol-3-phosphate 3-phosphatidyltransferase
VCLVLAQVTSYIKARAEATGLTANVGLVERAERLIITLGGTGLTGFGVPYALHVALWLLVGLSVVTVAQRIIAVWHSAEQRLEAGT